MPIPLRALLAVLLVGLLAPAVSAQEVIELHADQAVERALENNARLAASRADAEGAHAAYRQARAARLPALSASGRATHLGNVPRADLQVPGLDTSFAFFAIPRTQVYSEVSLEQPLFTGGRLHYRARAAASQARAAALLTRQEEADVALEIRAAFAGLRQALAVRDAVDAAVAAVQAHVRQVEALLAEGAALRIDLLAAQTRRSEVQLERLDAENAVRVSRLELNRLVGLPLGTEVVATGEAESTPPLSLDALVANATVSRSHLAALAEQVRALEAEVAAHRGEWLPEVAAVGRYVYARPNPINLLAQDEFHGHWEVGLTARWRLLDAGRPAATAGARARLAAARARLAEAGEIVAVEVTRRYLEVQRAREAQEVAAQHVVEAAESFQVVRAQFAEGAALPAQVLDAERVLRAAHARHAQAEADGAVAYAAVLSALGRVW
jgi:outer membrane protein